MKRARIFVAAVLMALPVVGATAAPAQACGNQNPACRTINWVCDLVAGPCIP